MSKSKSPTPLYYLTDGFPPRYGLYEKLANRLNKKGYLTPRGGPYTSDRVNNVISGKSTDERVRTELIRLKAEVQGRSTLVEKLLSDAEALLNAEEQIEEAVAH